MASVTFVTELDSDYSKSVYSECQYAGACAPKHKHRVTALKSEDHMATATSTIEREKALAWIARQLRWERTLATLRVGPEPTVLSKAA